MLLKTDFQFSERFDVHINIHYLESFTLANTYLNLNSATTKHLLIENQCNQRSSNIFPNELKHLIAG